MSSIEKDEKMLISSLDYECHFWFIPANTSFVYSYFVAFHTAGSHQWATCRKGSFCTCTQPMRRRYNVTSSFIGLAHTQNDPCAGDWSLGMSARVQILHPSSKNCLSVVGIYMHFPVPVYNFYRKYTWKLNPVITMTTDTGELLERAKHNDKQVTC